MKGNHVLRRTTLSFVTTLHGIDHLALPQMLTMWTRFAGEVEKLMNAFAEDTPTGVFEDKYRIDWLMETTPVGHLDLTVSLIKIMPLSPASRLICAPADCTPCAPVTVVEVRNLHITSSERYIYEPIGDLLTHVDDRASKIAHMFADAIKGPAAE